MSVDVMLTPVAGIAGEAHDCWTTTEAALTGESQPVTKNAAAKMEPETALADRRTMAFMGTQVVRGRARGVVRRLP